MRKTVWIIAAVMWCFIAIHVELQAAQIANRWQLSKNGGICWDLKKNKALPHKDHMAMSGQTVDMILEWQVSARGEFHANHIIRWPMLRTKPDDTHASLQRKLNNRNDPKPSVNGKYLSPGKTITIKIHGALAVTSRHDEDITFTRTIFPGVQSPAIIDLCRLTNTGSKYINVHIPQWRTQTATHSEKGVFGIYIVEQFLIGEGVHLLAPGENLTYALVRCARKKEDAPYFGDPAAELAGRLYFIGNLESKLVLETPDPVLNTLFAFSKIRATESIFSTRGGLMHGPGGYNKYLAAIWANDQAEYVNPFFPFLGNAAGNESAMNSFRHFARYMNPEYKPIPSSIIAEGRGYWNGAGDRGDMAMIAYGASRFALASGNPDWSAELWPLIRWCLEYCNRRKLPEGVIASETDELENRFPAGKANLNTSSLYYDALISSAYLAAAMNKDQKLTDRYRKQAEELRTAMKKYFEANIEGFDTYRYYDGNTILRSWICVPLTVGIKDRLDGTIDALFSPRLWTRDGLLTKAGTNTVWDRSTLYALRGIIASGRVDQGMEKLHALSARRLLGDHVPYVIEAFPEYNQSHLSAESGLYCRIFIEGLFGIRPTGLRKFVCTPSLPKDWNRMALHRVNAFGRVWDIEVVRNKKKLRVRITDAAKTVIYEKSLPPGQSHQVRLVSAAGCF